MFKENRENNKFDLFSNLSGLGVDAEVLDKYHDLISKIEFKNINIGSESGQIHLRMLAGLFSRQENNKTFLKNIINNLEIESLKKVSLVDTQNDEYKEFSVDNIDQDIGTNRRVDLVDCWLNDNSHYYFTLSADFRSFADESESNTFLEKEVFYSELGQENPVLQKFYGYFDGLIGGRKQLIIAKEYLPGKNIAQYLNELPTDQETLGSVEAVATETGFAMGYLYKRMDGRLLEDLKLENLIYNYNDTDGENFVCRACDHAGEYEGDQERKSSNQVLAHLESFFNVINMKSGQLLERGISSRDELAQAATDSLAAYLDSFVGEFEGDKALFKKMRSSLESIREQAPDQRFFPVGDDILEFAIDYFSA